MRRTLSLSELLLAAFLCVFGVLWAGTGTGTVASRWWVAVVVGVVVGPLLAVADQFGRPEWNLGLLAVAGLGIVGLFAMAFTATVPSDAWLGPLATGLGVAVAASRLYLHVARPPAESAA